MKMSIREQKFFELATVGGKGIHDAYREVYKPKSDRILTSCIANKKKRRPDIFETIDNYCRDLFQTAKEAQKAAVIKLATENALSFIEKREYLRKIISEEATEDTIVMIKDEPKVVRRKPSVNDRIKAIAVDNKMAGHNAPVGFKYDGKPEDSFIKLMMQIVKRRSNEQNVYSEE